MVQISGNTNQIISLPQRERCAQRDWEDLCYRPLRRYGELNRANCASARAEWLSTAVESRLQQRERQRALWVGLVFSIPGVSLVTVAIAIWIFR